MVHDCVNDSEGQAEDTNQNVREGQIADEKAGHICFFFASGDDANEADVSQQA